MMILHRQTRDGKSGCKEDSSDFSWPTETTKSQRKYQSNLVTRVLTHWVRQPRIQGVNHRNNRHRMRAPISCQSKNCHHKMADL